jgi:succinoglycan biosynthesis protein ExoV
MLRCNAIVTSSASLAATGPAAGAPPSAPPAQAGMRIVYYKDAVGNFGDDLNELIWPRVLPDDVRAAPDTVLVGIGSLLDQARFRDVETIGKRVFVLGSGAAYGALPAGSDSWDYLAVRGKLTARLIDRPEAAITDSAALLARLPDLVPQAERKGDILFMPHHRTLVNSRWQDAAERAGLVFVDPQWTPDRILACYGRAKLVVTEAMHGAIVADTLRIPWVPVMISPEISVFKWRDWASSLDLPFNPLPLPATTRLEGFRYERITRLTEASGRTVARAGSAALTDEELIADFRQRYRDEPKVIDAVSAPSGAKAVIKRAIQAFDGPKVAAAARALRQAAQSPAYLSDDTVFADRLGRLEDAVATLIAKVRAG